MTFLYIVPPLVLFISELRYVFIKLDLDERKMLMGIVGKTCFIDPSYLS